MTRSDLISRGITAAAALANWEFTFQAGYYTAARSWWQAYQILSRKGA